MEADSFSVAFLVLLWMGGVPMALSTAWGNFKQNESFEQLRGQVGWCHICTSAAPAEIDLSWVAVLF